MKSGDIILIPFPYSGLENVKLRPAVVVATTKDKYKDIVVCAISSVIPGKLSNNEIILAPSRVNQLRVKSVIKVDRIVTLKQKDRIANLGKLSVEEFNLFRQKFQILI